MSKQRTIWLGSTLGVLVASLIIVGCGEQPTKPTVTVEEPMQETGTGPIPLLYEHPSPIADVYCYDYNDELFHRTSIEQTDGRRNFDVPCPSPLGEEDDLPSTIVLHSVRYCKGDESTDGVDRYLHFLGDNYRTCDEVDNPPHHNGVYRAKGRYRAESEAGRLYYSDISTLTCHAQYRCEGDIDDIYPSREPNHVDIYCYTYSLELFHKTRTVSYPREGGPFCPGPPDTIVEPALPAIASLLYRPRYCITPDAVRLLYAAGDIFGGRRRCTEEVSAPPSERTYDAHYRETYEPQGPYAELPPSYLEVAP